MKSRIDSLFCLKGICAILIVFVHTDFFFRNFFSPISRLAVPLFFMISGYFMVNSDGTIKNNLYIKKQMNKIGKYILFSSLVYAVYNMFSNLFLFGKEFKWDLIFNRKFGTEFFYNLFLGSVFSDPLWYLTAYLQALGFVLFFKKLSSKTIFFLIVITYIGGLFVGKYLWIWTSVELPLALVRNVFTMAIPFLLLGILVRKEKDYFISLYNKYCYFFVLLLLLNYLEYWGILKWGTVLGGDYVLTTGFLVVFVFMYAISHPNVGRNSYLSFIGEYLSLDIYIYHSMILSLVYWINHKYGLFAVEWSFPIVLLITYFLALLINKVRSSLKRSV